MKPFVTTVISIIMCLSFFHSITAQQQKKKTIAVLNFVNSGGVDKDEISILTDRFNNYLVNTNIYKVLEREKMDAILKEQDFTMTDNCNSAECAVQIGQLLGMDLMIAGKIGKFGEVYTLDLRIIDVSTGEIQRTQSENYKGEKEGLLDMVEALAFTIAGLTSSVKKTETTTGKNTSDDASDEIKIGVVTKIFGSLEIKCEMNGVLYIDDKQIGEVAAGLIIPVEKLKIGKRKISIKGNEGEFSREVLIEENKKTAMTAKAESGKSSENVKINESQKNKDTLISNEVSTFTDPRDGKTYKTVKIGKQVWMAENLNYDAGEGCWCYNKNSSNCEKYGRLYTWEAAKRAVPKGWHLPSKKEFETLLKKYGGIREAYKHIILYGTSGFDAKLGGMCFGNDQEFQLIGKKAFFWTSSKEGKDRAWHFIVESNGGGTDLYYHGSLCWGYSVRCIKD